MAGAASVTPAPRSSDTGLADPVRSAGLTDAEEARAAELEARIVADERAADAARQGAADRRRGRPIATELAERPSDGGLAVRAAEEYAYVGRDVRRITLLGGSLIAILIILWVIAHLTGSAPI